MKVILITCSILALGTMPVLAIEPQSQTPVRRPIVIQPGGVVRIYTTTCPLNDNNKAANEQIVVNGTPAPQPPVDYSPCINWATNRVVLELNHGNKYDKVITQRINRLQELGGTDIVKKFLDIKGREFVAALQQQSPEVYQKHSDLLKQLFSSYGLTLH